MDVTVSQHQPSSSAQQAVILYGSAKSNIDLVTVHPIENTETGLVLKEGVPATRRALLAMFEALGKRVKQPIKFLGANTLAVGDDSVVWWVPARKHRIVFDCDVIGKRAGEVPHPPLLFAVSPAGWFIFALPKNERPSVDTPLHVSPYLNVWESGEICSGSTDVPKGKVKLNPDSWTKAFFESAFTHSNVHKPNGLIVDKAGPYAFWKDMLDGVYPDFPVEKLVPTKYTVASVLKLCEESA